MIEVAHEEYSKDPNGFEKFLIDAEKPLKEFANVTECPECGQLRWKNVKQIPSKVIWYFPPIPRFKRLFRSIEYAENLTWHASERIEDGTLLDISGKSKDELNARRDLVDLKLQPELAPISSEKKIFIPPACYTLTKEGKRCVLKTLSRIKVPEGYSSNITNLVSMKDLKLNSLKSHDCHVLIQQLFPIAIISVLPKHVRYVITRLCIFFNSVCNKVLDAKQLDKLEEDIVVSTELEVGNSGVSDNLWWIAHDPHPFVITYSGYAINGCRYHTKSSEKDRRVQNSGNSGGVRIDELGYTLVDLNRVGHKSDSFILASQAKQVFYVEDPSDVRWSIVLTPPQRDFEDRYNDDELGDTILRCEGIPNGMPDVYLNNDLDENVSTYVWSDCEGTWIPT
ncbi:transposase [Cucumis melo var. makuwa]|uniref:Transposase n=1 Tax=Cucumis melo var. makuwa TaxID=1194695 RepID=A0A5D3C116_CUCMM|nr:transposase [Cucumis melo var. makuwa]